MSVTKPENFFEVEVIYVSRRRINAGEVEEALIRLCLEEWEVPHPTLTNKEITGWAQLEDDAEWQCVAIAYLKPGIGLEELEFHTESLLF